MTTPIGPEARHIQWRKVSSDSEPKPDDAAAGLRAAESNEVDGAEDPAPPSAGACSATTRLDPAI